MLVVAVRGTEYCEKTLPVSSGWQFNTDEMVPTLTILGEEVLLRSALILGTKEYNRQLCSIMLVPRIYNQTFQA